MPFHVTSRFKVRRAGISRRRLTISVAMLVFLASQSQFFRSPVQRPAYSGSGHKQLSVSSSSQNYDFQGVLTGGGDLASSSSYQLNLTIGGITGASTSSSYKAEFLSGTSLLKFLYRPADVAVTGLTASRSFSYKGVISPAVNITVGVANQGPQLETFIVRVRANSTVIGSQTVFLATEAATTVTMSWDASQKARGVYQLVAEVPQVSLGEVDLADNTLQGPSFTVRLRGDVNNDCLVDIVDLATVGSVFG